MQKGTDGRFEYEVTDDNLLNGLKDGGNIEIYLRNGAQEWRRESENQKPEGAVGEMRIADTISCERPDQENRVFKKEKKEGKKEKKLNTESNQTFG